MPYSLVRDAIHLQCATPDFSSIRPMFYYSGTRCSISQSFLSQRRVVLSCFCHVWLCVTLWSAACHAPQPMGFFQARILEWVAMPSSRGSSQSEWSESRSVVSDSLPSHGQAHGILQARILEWVDFTFSRGSSKPRNWTQVSHIAGRFFTSWATREAQPRDQICLSYVSLSKLGSLPLAPPEKPFSLYCCSNVSLSSPASSLPLQILFTFWVFSSKLSFCIRLYPNTLTHTPIFAALRVSLKLSSNLMPHRLDTVLLHYMNLACSNRS